MKKIMLITILGIAPVISFAQKQPEKKVPAIIVKSLYQAFPNAKQVKWDKEKDNYEASFKITGVDNSVLLNAQGKVMETEVEIKTNQLPKNALNYLEQHFKNKKIKEAAKIVTQNGTITYEAEINGNDLLFDQNGSFIKSSKT